MSKIGHCWFTERLIFTSLLCVPGLRPWLKNGIVIHCLDFVASDHNSQKSLSESCCNQGSSVTNLFQHIRGMQLSERNAALFKTYQTAVHKFPIKNSLHYVLMIRRGPDGKQLVMYLCCMSLKICFLFIQDTQVQKLRFIHKLKKNVTPSIWHQTVGIFLELPCFTCTTVQILFLCHITQPY